MARDRFSRSASTITSPVRWTPAVTPSAARFATAVAVGQKRRAEMGSVRTRFTSPGIRSPASICATGTCTFAAARAPARVEFVSP